MIISLHSFECFVKVAETQHMTLASHELNISQSQLSRIIAELEKSLDARLFDREGKGIILNACGQAFYRYAQRILALYGEAQTSVREISLHAASQLTVTANITAYMPGLLRELKNAAPDINYRQTMATRQQLVSQLREGLADFAICAPAVSELELSCRHLRYEGAGAIYYDGHWLANRKSVGAEELLKEDFICVAKGFVQRDMIDEACQRFGWHPNFIVETLEPTQIGSYVKAGLGVSLLPITVVQQDEWFRSHYVPLEGNFNLDICLVWKKDRVFSEIDHMFYDTVLKYFSGVNAADEKP